MPGLLELLPAEQVAFNRMLATIRSVFERFGYLPIETPAIELTDILLTKTGGETERQVYLVQSTGSIDQGRAPDLALPFDLTVPLARYVAEHEHDLSFPFRRYQIQKVYRGESPQRGRFREFYQCDVDVIDRDTLNLGHDAEVVAIIDAVFEALRLGDFTIRINNRKLMRGVLERHGVIDPELQAAALREVDKLAKRGRQAVSISIGELGVGDDATTGLMDFVARGALSRQEAASFLGSIDAPGPLLREGIAEVATVLATVSALGVPDDRFVFDPAIARGLDYYTGTVYETTLDAHPEIGSICSGGRYDDLAGLYTSTRLPGVGLSIGFTRLFWQLREAGLLAAADSSVVAIVTLMDQEGLDYAISVATRLREAGINTAAVLEAGKLGKQLKQADRIGIRFALIAGTEERAAGTVTIKDLFNQTQEEVAVADAAGFILAND